MSYKNLMTPKIDEVREAIDNINYYHVTSGTYHGRWTDDEARREYQELLDLLPSIPGLSASDVITLTEEIQSKIDRIGVYVDPDYNVDTIKNFEDFKKAIERVHYQHRYDAGAMFGTLTADEAERDYNTLIGLLDKVKGLTEEQKVELKTEIDSKIEGIPGVQQEKRAEREAYEAEFAREFEAAKQRFNSLSIFERIKLRRAKKAPEHQNVDFMGINEVKALYKK